MGISRNGARTLLNLLAKCCKLSHLPGFQTGLANILGSENATALFNLWNPLCAFVETLIAADNYFNQVDTVAEAAGDEDITLA